METHHPIQSRVELLHSRIKNVISGDNSFHPDCYSYRNFKGGPAKGKATEHHDVAIDISLSIKFLGDKPLNKESLAIIKQEFKEKILNLDTVIKIVSEFPSIEKTFDYKGYLEDPYNENNDLSTIIRLFFDYK
jgi:hypothetical protein